MWSLRFALPLSILLTLLFSVSSCVDKDQKQRKINKLKVICLGDSITYGHLLPDPSRQSYPARLRQLAQGRWQVLNLGVNGATVVDRGDSPMRSQNVYKRAIQSNPDIIVLMLGTNDIKNVNWRYLRDFERDYLRLLDRLKSQPSKPHVLLCSIPPVLQDYPNGLTATRQQKVNVLVQKIAAASRVDYLDIYTGMADTPSFFVDGIHPNALGAQKIASLVFARISSL